MLAVPAFIFISSYLFALQGAGRALLQKRLRRLFILLTFWTTAFILFNHGYKGLLYFIPQSVESFVLTVLNAGSTIYYFFTCLMICLVVTRLISRWNITWLWAGFVLTVFLLAVLPELTVQTGYFPISAYWSPLNFFAYPFAAVLFVRNKEIVLAKRILIFWLSTACCIVFAVLEWNYAVKGIYFTHQGFAIPPYTRPSLVFGIAAVAVVSLHPAIQPNRLITFMAGNALSLYCLHVFFYPIIWDILGKWTHSAFNLTYGSIVLAIAWCYLLAHVLKNYLKQAVLV